MYMPLLICKYSKVHFFTFFNDLLLHCHDYIVVLGNFLKIPNFTSFFFSYDQFHSLGAIADLELAIRSKKINDDIMVVC